MIKAVIFDLDGTLLNTIDDLAISCNATLKKHGFPTHAVDKYKYFVGNGMTKLVERALPENIEDPKFISQFLQDFINYYQQHQEDQTRPYTGIPEMLNILQKKRYTLAVASNKIDASVKLLIKRYFPEINFSAVYGQRKNIQPKPDPRIIEDILKDLNIQPENSVMIGDSAVDILTAKNAGLKSIGVLWGFRTKHELLENGAEDIVSRPEEIPMVLEKISLEK